MHNAASSMMTEVSEVNGHRLTVLLGKLCLSMHQDLRGIWFTSPIRSNCILDTSSAIESVSPTHSHHTRLWKTTFPRSPCVWDFFPYQLFFPILPIWSQLVTCCDDIWKALNILVSHSRRRTIVHTRRVFLSRSCVT